MREVRAGVWHWTARHPEWEPTDEFDEVSAYAIDAGQRLLLIDPLSLPSVVEEFATGREPVIVLTCEWHRRDADELAQRLGAEIFVPPPDRSDPGPGVVYEAGSTLPFGVQALPGLEPYEVMLWLEAQRALVIGDSVVDLGNGLDVAWLRPGQTRAQALEILRPALDLPIELVLPTHGAPTDREALAAALA